MERPSPFYMNNFAELINNRTSSLIHGISNTHRVLFAVIALAAVLRFGWVLYAQTIPGSDFYQYDLLAQRLANGQGYVDEFGEPSAFYAIGWPFFLSIVYRIFGYSLIAAQLVNALMAVGSVALVFVISRYLLNDRFALLAALLVAINPTLVLYSSAHGTESLFIFQLLLISWLLMRSIKSPTRRSSSSGRNMCSTRCLRSRLLHEPTRHSKQP
jgi:4-amino-4-deoxy-L-arabinose transferase-like glycosyltransferase